MSDTGRPRKPIKWDDLDKLLHIQCTQEEIASFFDCSIDTLSNRCKEEKGVTFSEYSRQKRKVAHISLRRKQWQIAIDKGNVAMLIWLGKQYLDQSDKHDIEENATLSAELTVPAMTKDEALKLLAARQSKSKK